MAKVFISYKREDRALAEKLGDALTARGHEVWWDKELGGGESFRRSIERELHSAQAVVVIWTPNSIASTFVCDEADWANRHQKLVPVRFSQTFDIPIGFGQVHIENLEQWNGSPDAAELQRLDKSIDAVVNDRFRETMLVIGQRALQGGSIRNEALTLFRDLGVSVGGLPLGRFLVGAFMASLFATAVYAFGEALRGRFSLDSVLTIVAWLMAFMLVRGAMQFVLLGKGRSSRRFFDGSFARWLIACLTVAALLLIAFSETLGGFFSDLPIVTLFLLGLVMLARVMLLGFAFLVRQA